MKLQALRRGRAVVGVMFRMINTPAIVPMAVAAGLDFIMVDMEHGACSIETFENICIAGRQAGIAVLVRVPELTRGYVSRALDCGASGVMVPMLESAEKAKSLVRWGKYPPIGGRGLSTCGAHTDYRPDLGAPEVMQAANRNTLTIAQIETRQAVDAIEEIASVEGLDVLLVGPNDLSVSLGCPGQLHTALQHDAIMRVASAAKRHRKILGMHADLPLLKKWSRHGLRFALHSLDAYILADGLRRAADSVRVAVQG